MKAGRRWLQSPFVRNVVLVASGTAGAQLISLAFAPVLTRIYGPEPFGTLGVFLALGSVLAPMAAMSFPIALVLARDDSEAREIARLSFRTALSTSLIVVIVLLAAGDTVASAFNLGNATLLLLLSPYVLFSGWLQIAQQWLIRQGEFKVTARVAVAQSLLINSTKAGIGVLLPVGAVLVWIATAAAAIHAFLLSVGARTKLIGGRSSRETSLGATGLAGLAANYRDFPLYRAPQGMLNAASQGLPVLLLAASFGSAAAGYYALGRLVMMAPITVLGQAVGSVFYPRAAKAQNAGDSVADLIIKATVGLAAIGIVPFGIIVVFGPWLFATAFGEAWLIAGEYAQWLAIWLFAAFINRPSVAALPVIKMQGMFLLFEVVSLLLRVSAMVGAAWLTENDVTAVAAFCVTGAVLNAALVVITIGRSRKLAAGGRISE